MLAALSLLAACVGPFDIVRPVAVETPLQWLGVAKGKEEVWRQVSARPIQDRFVIDGLRKDAGVITLT